MDYENHLQVTLSDLAVILYKLVYLWRDMRNQLGSMCIIYAAKKTLTLAKSVFMHFCVPQEKHRQLRIFLWFLLIHKLSKFL